MSKKARAYRARRRAAGLTALTHGARQNLYRKRKLRQQRIAELKLKSGCVDCGYREHPSALEFDHLPGQRKDFTIATAPSRGRSWTRIENEIKKCEVVCANCHRVRTAKRRLAKEETEPAE